MYKLKSDFPQLVPRLMKHPETISLTENSSHLYTVAHVTLGIPLAALLALKKGISLLSPTSSGLILSARPESISQTTPIFF